MPWWLASVSTERATAIRVADEGYTPILFVCEQHKITRNRYVPNVLVPAFPNYLFVATSPLGLKALGKVQGVHDFVRGAEEEVSEVRDAEIEERCRAARQVSRIRWLVEKPESAFVVGDYVRVEEWSSGTHEVEAVLGDGYLVVGVTLFGRKMTHRVREIDCVVAQKTPRRFRRRDRSPLAA